MKPIKDFEIISYGLTAFDQDNNICDLFNYKYNYIVAGTGTNYIDAINDCLNQMAERDFNTTNMRKRISKKIIFPDITNVFIKRYDLIIEGFLRFYVLISWS